MKTLGFDEETMIIREARSGDEAAIRKVETAAFEQSMEAELVEALDAAGDTVLSLVAEEGGKIVGHVLFSRLRSPEGCLALAPIGVLPERQKRGIGSALIREGLARLAKADWKALFLLGYPDYYRRFGFSVEAAERFETGYPKEATMVLELAEGGLGGCSGPIVYAPAFEMFE
ncbi:GNAT family N-acetyltransferase [Denitrobaculum tricleocarpae]|uniref:N-acetyltransferase n=1 Tax=Denitrobaculum tricleocarpae TaxID=2591009 RepID=A0A545TMH7_9PROT|nr:N-acetyltransferase [Denitrobaculum tricleocarpae]TQV78396.1 N-acetyltransferase [Denitrobaculum tricleocarpae]